MKEIVGVPRWEPLTTTQKGTDVLHAGGAIHPVSVEWDSVLYNLFGQGTLTVNSFHHQAVKEPGEGIRVTARAGDGVVEAWEYGDRVMAVQFHPEKMARTDASWLAPFRCLVRWSLLSD